MSTEPRDELALLSEARVRKMTMECERVLNEHMVSQTDETESRVVAGEQVKKCVMDKMDHLERAIGNVSIGQQQGGHFIEQMNKGVDQLTELFKEVSISRENKTETMRNKALQMLARMPTESRQELQNEKEAILFSKLQEFYDHEVEVCESVTKHIHELQAKSEEVKVETGKVEEEIAITLNRKDELTKELQEKNALVEQLTKESEESKRMLSELQAEEAEIKTLIPSEDAQKAEEEKQQLLEQKTLEIEMLAGEMEVEYEQLVSKHANEYKELENEYQLKEAAFSEEDAALDIQLTELNAQSHHVNLMKKGAQQRLEMMMKKMHQDYGDVSIEELGRGLDEAKEERARQMQAAQAEFERLLRLKEEKMKEIAEKLAVFDAERTQQIAEVTSKKNDLLDKKKKLNAQMSKSSSESQKFMKDRKQYEAEIVRLEADKVMSEAKISAFTNMKTPAKPRGEMVVNNVTTQSSGDSDVTEAVLEVDGIQPFSPDTIRQKNSRQSMMSKSFGFTDESGAEDVGNDSLLSSFEQQHQVKNAAKADSSEILDMSAVSEEHAPDRRAAGDAEANKVLDSDDSLMQFNDSLEEPQERCADIVSDLNSPPDRFPNNIFLNESDNQELMGASSPPPNISEDESDISMQSIWD